MAAALLRRGFSPVSPTSSSTAAALIARRGFSLADDVKDPLKGADDSGKSFFTDKSRSASVDYISSLLNRSGNFNREPPKSSPSTSRSSYSEMMSILGGSFDFNSSNGGGNKGPAKSGGSFISRDEIYGGDKSSNQDFDNASAKASLFSGLDFTKPTYQKKRMSNEFETTTNEVLRKADFRNVRFLGNFLTDAGLIIKRSQTQISAKAQRKVVREIKTARAFGLMPFTTMGKKRFVFGRNIQEEDDVEHDFDDYENKPFRNATFVADDDAL